MNKVKNGNKECMCIGCVNNLMERIIDYLEFKNGENNEIMKSIQKESKGGDKPFLKFHKEEILDVKDIIKELYEFKQYNDSLIKKPIKN
jgi:predicted Fe-S protein YdhL (DUF1289 family)|tara:strand:+ start:266 stop:532 length:267 start_codon:yes stop_codon:yes gene_type:complete